MPFMDGGVEKYCISGQATDKNMKHVQFMLNT
jgi:hypothetical protein